eukprot:COSAG04_NODE_8133_length_1018_cov_5.420022_1_plen_39_part_10
MLLLAASAALVLGEEAAPPPSPLSWSAGFSSCAPHHPPG